MQTFLNQDHPRETEYNDAWKELVPQNGKCDTVAGEMLRAASRIYYDYTNNGFGNNWTGALNYLDEYLGVPASTRKLLRKYAKSKTVRHTTYDENDPILNALDRIMEHVLDAVPSNMKPNTVDMFDLQERDY